MDEIFPDQPLALICRYSAADKRWDDFVITGENAAHYSNHFSNIDALAVAFHPLQPDATKLPRPLPSFSNDRDKMRQLIERSER